MRTGERRYDLRRLGSRRRKCIPFLPWSARHTLKRNITFVPHIIMMVIRFLPAHSKYIFCFSYLLIEKRKKKHRTSVARPSDTGVADGHCGNGCQSGPCLIGGEVYRRDIALTPEQIWYHPGRAVSPRTGVTRGCPWYYPPKSCLRRQDDTFQVSGDLSDETVPESLNPSRDDAEASRDWLKKCSRDQGLVLIQGSRIRPITYFSLSSTIMIVDNIIFVSSLHL